jgi:hypothetical protein
LDQYTVFAVQARYEETAMGQDESLDREAIIREVSAMVEHIETLLGSSEP